KVRDAATGGDLLTLELPKKDALAGLAVSPDGHRLATGCVAPLDAVRLWDATPGGEAFVLHSRSGGGDGGALSPHRNRGRRAPRGVPLAAGEAPVWETATARPVSAQHGHLGGLTRVAFSPDGTLLATAVVDCVILSDPATGKVRRRLIGHTGAAHGLGWSPDG